MLKYNRNYELIIEERGDTVDSIVSKNIIIKRPFTLEFDIVRKTFPSCNNGSFRVYNLKETTRNKIRFDFYDFGILRSISLKAGYGEKNLATVFEGNISQALSTREGNNFVTQIEAYEGGFAYSNAFTNREFPKGLDVKSVIKDLIKSLEQYGVTEGAIGDFSGKLGRGNSYSGNTLDLLNSLTGGSFYIDNGKLHCLKDNEYLNGETLVITQESGLLGAPAMENAFVKVDMLFEPRVYLGQRVQLESTVSRRLSGFYKVISIHHRGTISDAICGDSITTLGLSTGTGELKEIS